MEKLSVLMLPNDSSEKWVDFLAHLDTRIQRLSAERALPLTAASNNILDTLVNFDSLDGTGKNTLRLSLKNLMTSIEKAENGLDSGSSIKKPTYRGPLPFAKISSINEILPGEEYRVSSLAQQEFRVTFTAEVLKDIKTKHTDPLVQKHLLHAVSKGLVPAHNVTGIKIMNFHEAKLGPIAEVKNVGNSAAGIRIYGTLKNGLITFSYVGGHIEGNSHEVLYNRFRN